MQADLSAIRITAIPGVRSGQPIIRGTRLTVWDILGWLAAGQTQSEILVDFPELEPDDIRAALQFASSLKEKVAR